MATDFSRDPLRSEAAPLLKARPSYSPGKSQGLAAPAWHSDWALFFVMGFDRITKEIGIRVTPHQFRHLAAA